MKKIKAFFKTLSGEWKAMKKPEAVWKDTFFTLFVSVLAGGIFMGIDTLMSLLYKLI